MKEKVAEIINNAQDIDSLTCEFKIVDSDKATKQVLNLFKAEVDKLTVIDDDEILIKWKSWLMTDCPSKEDAQEIALYRLKSLLADELQDIKKQLLEGLEG